MTQYQIFKNNSKLHKYYIMASVVSTLVLLSFVIFLFLFKPEDLIKGTSSGTLPYVFMFLAGLYAVNNKDYLLMFLFVVIKSIMALFTILQTLLVFTQVVNGIPIMTIIILALNLIVTVVMTAWAIVILTKMHGQRQVVLE